MSTARLSVQEYTEGILKNNRFVLSKAITLVESSLSADQKIAEEVMDYLLPYTGKSLRIGITGVPGVGKSTFIETFGNFITEQGHKVAVLTIDPSSQVTRGSILGDKTRMETLSRNPNAFIRPSASQSTLGGVAARTREAMLLCEAAGFDVIIIETVGVGQSEVAAHTMVDFFLLLMLAGAGDELQGIKKGIVEMADAIAITKADGDNIARASEAQRDYQHALHLYERQGGWQPKVLTCSSLNNNGIDKIWEVVKAFQRQMTLSGHFDINRKNQNLNWFNELFVATFRNELESASLLRERKAELQKEVSESIISPRTASRKFIQAYHDFIKSQIT